MISAPSRRKSQLSRTASALLLAGLLFYLPTMPTVFGHAEPHDMVVTNLIASTLYVIIFIMNYFFLVPDTLFRRDRKWRFFIVNGLLVGAGCAIVPLWLAKYGQHSPRPPFAMGAEERMTGLQSMIIHSRFVIRDGVIMLLSGTLAYALRLSARRGEIRQRELEVSEMRRNMELRSLRAQLNPHFLFNSINNIYTLIGISPERAREALHSLSGMLRYMIYDGSVPSVPLVRELDAISEYSSLMKLRLGSRMTLRCELDRKGTDVLTIAPLLLLTIVENAFKHGAPKDGSGKIEITFSADESRVECRVSNTYSGDSARREGGVGISNVERQLKLLYPGCHTFTYGGTDGLFTAVITIEKRALTDDEIKNV